MTDTNCICEGFYKPANCPVHGRQNQIKIEGGKVGLHLLFSREEVATKAFALLKDLDELNLGDSANASAAIERLAVLGLAAKILSYDLGPNSKTALGCAFTVIDEVFADIVNHDPETCENCKANGGKARIH